MNGVTTWKSFVLTLPGGQRTRLLTREPRRVGVVIQPLSANAVFWVGADTDGVVLTNQYETRIIAMEPLWNGACTDEWWGFIVAGPDGSVLVTEGLSPANVVPRGNQRGKEIRITKRKR